MGGASQIRYRPHRTVFYCFSSGSFPQSLRRYDIYLSLVIGAELLEVYWSYKCLDNFDLICYYYIMIEYELYDWNQLINGQARNSLANDIKGLIDQGQYWTNSPRYQTNINVFGLPGEEWNNLKMSFIWSCFAYLKKPVSIKTIKAWSYMTSLKYTVEDRDRYWHQHLREDSKVISGVYYLKVPENIDTVTAGTEFSPHGPESVKDRFFVEARTGYWAIWPGTAWHRPGILQSQEDRYIVAADLEF